MKYFTIALAMLLAAAPANAAVLDFQSANLGSSSTLTLDGFNFSYVTGQAPVIFTDAGGAKAFGDDSTNTRFGSIFRMSRIDGLAFDINSIVFGRTSDAIGTRITVNGSAVSVLADGQVYKGAANLQNLASVQYDAFSGGGAVGLKSIDYTVRAAVPEPATWAMMMLGFGVVGTALRRKAKLRLA